MKRGQKHYILAQNSRGRQTGTVYESHMEHTREYYFKALDALKTLRVKPIHAARDLFYIHCLLRCERGIRNDRWRLKEIFSERRNARALIASFVVMFMQQYCGVNILANVKHSVPDFS
jgi:hypothetical protein